jgi:hypothetical protein
MYPYMNEYDDDDLFESNIPMHNHPSGKANFYSAARPAVVNKHFEWMNDYGITGVCHMRFLSNMMIIINVNGGTWGTKECPCAAEPHGRAFAVSYNPSGRSLNDDVLDLLKED